jgi:hypothetical protein
MSQFPNPQLAQEHAQLQQALQGQQPQAWVQPTPQQWQQPPQQWQQPQFQQPQQPQQFQPPVVQQPAQQQGALIMDAPDWLVAAAKDSPLGTEDLRQYMLPSFLQIRQGQCQDAEFAQRSVPGDVYLSPERRIIYSAQQRIPVAFTPILQFTDFTVENPNGVAPFIRVGPTTDENSDIARRARNKDWRKEPCPEAPGKFCHYVENMRFLIFLHIDNAPTLPVLLTFKRAEFFTGRSFCNQLMSLGGNPMYAARFMFTTSLRTNDEGQWYGLDIVRDTANRWVSQQEFSIFKQLHLDLRDKKERGEIRTAETEDTSMPAGLQPQQGQAGPVYTGPPSQQPQAGPQAPQQPYTPQQPNGHANGQGGQGIDPNAALSQAAAQTRNTF